MENPELLSGIPLVIAGAIGFLMIMGLLFAPERQPQAEPRVAHAPGHPTPAQYVGIGVFLAAVTFIEVWVYYVDQLDDVLAPILIVLSLTKFATVVLFFMHLYFDSKLFSTLFSGGLMLAMALFIVVLATLGAALT